MISINIKTTLSSGIICILFIAVTFGIDRSEFNNFRANERHDGYLSFSTPLQFPLSLKWSNANTSCTFSDGKLSFALTNQIFYCLANETDDAITNACCIS